MVVNGPTPLKSREYDNDLLTLIERFDLYVYRTLDSFGR